MIGEAAARWIIAAIAEDLGLPVRALTLHPIPEVCPGCPHCVPGQWPDGKRIGVELHRAGRPDLGRREVRQGDHGL
jgi:hypothetical protein